MPTLESEAVRLEVAADGRLVRLIDQLRASTWEWRRAGEATVERQGDTLAMTVRTDAATLTYRWAIEGGHAICTLRVEGAAERVPLVGPFRVPGQRTSALIPQYQGALLRGGRETWQAEAVRGGHTNLSLGMLASIDSRGSLLLVPERLVGWVARYGNDAAGPWVAFDAVPLDSEGWRAMRVALHLCDAGVTPVALTYRGLMQARGQWVGWDEKIAARPALAKLFGALPAFIGYVHDDTTDYVGGIARLRKVGFESVLAYPARFAHYTPLTMADGRPPIHLSDQAIAAMQQAGALVAPWAWTYEGMDDGTPAMRGIFRHGPNGPVRGWAMDGQQWYHVCVPYQAQHIARRLATDMHAMDWLHFDVNATYPTCACHCLEHDAHAGLPLTLEESIAETQRLFAAGTVGNRIVSSEGFNDAYTNTYDIGTTKMVPLGDDDPPAVPVPLTMLVYHDCCVHDWWEMHNYNENPCWGLGATHTGTSHLGRAGAGEPELKAALDALAGLPPNVFCFGMQYGWVDRPGGKTYPFRMSLDDAPVQRALRAALPVTRLHKRVGRLALTDFNFVAGNLLVQQSTFADGTRITANLGTADVDVPGVGSLPARTWHQMQL